MHARKILVLGAVALTSVTAGTAAVVAVGEGPPSRDAATRDAASRFAAFDRPQEPRDVFRPRGDDPQNLAAAYEIAKTSRLVASTAGGEAYAFLNARNEACFLWRPAVGDVSASDCSAAKDGNAPGILMGQGGTLARPTVAGLVPKGTERVTVTASGGVRIDVPIGDGAYVYEGASPFTISWDAPDGSTFTNEVKPIDVRSLKPVG